MADLGVVSSLSVRLGVAGAPPGKSCVRYTLWACFRALGGSGTSVPQEGVRADSAFNVSCHLWIVGGSPNAIEVGRIYHAFLRKNENRYFIMFFNVVVIF